MTIDEIFDRFWTAYPRKVAKPVAKKAFVKKVKDAVTFAKVINALELHKKTPQWIKDGGQYIPHPATWLNQERYNDEIAFIKPGEVQHF